MILFLVDNHGWMTSFLRHTVGVWSPALIAIRSCCHTGEFAEPGYWYRHLTVAVDHSICLFTMPSVTFFHQNNHLHTIKKHCPRVNYLSSSASFIATAADNNKWPFCPQRVTSHQISVAAWYLRTVFPVCGIVVNQFEYSLIVLDSSWPYIFMIQICCISKWEMPIIRR